MIAICDHPVIADPPSYSDMHARLAALRDQGGVRGEIAPAGGATPEQLDAMRESMEILSDPKLAVRVRAGRQAVASGDVVALEEPSGEAPPTPREWRVTLTGPVARELEQSGEPSSTAVRELLRAIAARPDERGRALGMGLVGLWSARAESQRVLYALHEEQRLMTVLSIDVAEGRAARFGGRTDAAVVYNDPHDVSPGDESMRVYYPKAKTSVETIKRFGELADRGGDPEAAAMAWGNAGFDDEMTARWLKARCFDPDAARALTDLGVKPEQAAVRTRDGGDYRDTVAYKVANGDLTARGGWARSLSSR